MDQDIGKVNVVLSQIEKMKKKIEQIRNCPFFPAGVKAAKLAALEASIRDSQVFAATYMGTVLESLNKDAA